MRSAGCACESCSGHAPRPIGLPPSVAVRSVERTARTSRTQRENARREALRVVHNVREAPRLGSVGVLNVGLGEFVKEREVGRWDTRGSGVRSPVGAGEITCEHVTGNKKQCGGA